MLTVLTDFFWGFVSPNSSRDVIFNKKWEAWIFNFKITNTQDYFACSLPVLCWWNLPPILSINTSANSHGLLLHVINTLFICSHWLALILTLLRLTQRLSSCNLIVQHHQLICICCCSFCLFAMGHTEAATGLWEKKRWARKSKRRFPLADMRRKEGEEREDGVERMEG